VAYVSANKKTHPLKLTLGAASSADVRVAGRFNWANSTEANESNSFFTFAN
jgi:hypothetical protein